MPCVLIYGIKCMMTEFRLAGCLLHFGRLPIYITIKMYIYIFEILALIIVYLSEQLNAHNYSIALLNIDRSI